MILAIATRLCSARKRCWELLDRNHEFSIMGQRRYWAGRGSRDIRVGFVLPLLVFWAVIAALLKAPQPSPSGPANPLAIQIEHHYPSTQADSRATLAYINQLRQQYGKPELAFDDQVYALALARAMDMRTHHYLDHTNLQTGECPDNLKSHYGLAPTDYVAENAFGIRCGFQYLGCLAASTTG